MQMQTGAIQKQAEEASRRWENSRRKRTKQMQMEEAQKALEQMQKGAPKKGDSERWQGQGGAR